MGLDEIFLSDKLVQPVWFSTENQSNDLYANAGRARLVAEDQSTWKVGGSSLPKYNWVVEYGKVSPDDYEERILKKDKKLENKKDGKNTIRNTIDTWVNIYIGKQEDWARDIIKAYKSIGLSENAIVNLLSKNALETGWGLSAQGNFNFGNITAGSTWNGDIVIGHDTDANGNPITQRWRAYRDLKHFVLDEVDFLKRLYGFDPNDDLEAFLSKLQDGKCRYAEARDYKDKVRAMKAGVLRRVRQYG